MRNPVTPAKAGAPFLILLLVFLAACSTPVPTDKSAYVGQWTAKDRSLLITQDGRVEYERKGAEGKGNVSIKAPIQEFDGNDFKVGIGIFTTRFVVSRPPFHDGAVWKMVVDGVELTKGTGEGNSLRV
jgi:hypothetical protein